MLVNGTGGGGPAPLTAAQRRLWVTEQFNPGSDAYLIDAVIRIEPGADPALLEAALDDVAAAHDAFRTEFGWDDDGDPAQFVRDRVELPVPRGSGPGTPAEPFDLERAPLVRFRMVCRDNTATALELSAHHIVFDGWSLGILVRDLGLAYDARAAGTRADLSGRPGMAGFAEAEAAWLAGAEGRARVDALAGLLRGAPGLLAVPTDRPRGAQGPDGGHAGAGLHFTLPWELAQDITEFARERRTTLNMVGLAAFSAVLAHWSGSDDIVVGSAFAGRTSLAAERCVGCFINVVPLRLAVDTEAPFEAHLDRVREGVLRGAEYQDVPFDRLVEALNPPRSLTHNPLVQVAFGVQNTEPASYEGGIRLTGEPAPDDDAEARLDLTLWLEERPEGLKAIWTYRKDLFERSTVARLNQWFFRTLRQGCLDPSAPPAAPARS
ncbi:condensation domain-containing protein [Streptomyces bauhiniae]